MKEPERIFFLELRELRPELAGFINACKRGCVSSQEHRIVTRRLQTLLQLEALESYASVTAAARALMQTLQEEKDIAVWQRQATGLREAALHMLTFSAEAKDASLNIISERGKKPILLIADDDRIVREMMRQLFAHQSELYIAADGTQAWSLIEQHKPDMVILDDFMPGMTGLKLIERLSATPALKSIPVLMLTGSDRPQDIARAMQAGAVGYITKPFDPSEIVSRVREQLNH